MVLHFDLKNNLVSYIIVSKSNTQPTQ